MSRGKASGIVPSAAEVPIIIGMVARGDRRHDIAAWVGFNQGRIKDAEDGKFGPPATNANMKLPPSGSPGLKGRRLRDAIAMIQAKVKSGDNLTAEKLLQQAIVDYDRNDPKSLLLSSCRRQGGTHIKRGFPHSLRSQTNQA